LGFKKSCSAPDIVINRCSSWQDDTMGWDGNDVAHEADMVLVRDAVVHANPGDLKVLKNIYGCIFDEYLKSSWLKVIRVSIYCIASGIGAFWYDQIDLIAPNLADATLYL